MSNRCTTLSFSNYSKKQDKKRPLLKRLKVDCLFFEADVLKILNVKGY